MELARTYLITGFPWNLLGYAVQASGVRQIASVTGVYGLSFLAVATSALLAWVLISPRRARAGLALAGWLGLLLLAQWRLAPPPAADGQGTGDSDPAERALGRCRVGILDSVARPHPTSATRPVQRFRGRTVLVPDSVAPGSSASKTAQIAKFKMPQIEQNRRNPSPLLIWAENPAPFFFTRDPIFRNAMENMARQTHAIRDCEHDYPSGCEGRHDHQQRHSPWIPKAAKCPAMIKFIWCPLASMCRGWALPGLVHKITSEVGNFVPGSSYPVAKSPGGNIGVFICYEAIIPQLARQLVANGAGVLVNISNDAWYGDSAAAYQHLEMARLRAIENHRYLLRATNNGLTTLIDPYGRVLEEIPRYQRLAMPAHFDFETRQTFYTAHGDVFAWLCAAMAALMLAGRWGEGASQKAKCKR